MQILVFVQGFSTKVATAKTLIFSDLHSWMGILYESAYAGNHCISSVVHSSHSRTRILYKKCSCRTCLRLLQNWCEQHMCILVQGFSIKKGTHAGNYDIFAVLEFFILELPGTLGPDACNFLLFCINDNKEFAPGSPGAGSWQFLCMLLITSRNSLPGALGPDPGNLSFFLLTTMRNLLLGAPGPDLAISY